jgi:hypothetical protein
VDHGEPGTLPLISLAMSWPMPPPRALSCAGAVRAGDAPEEVDDDRLAVRWVMSPIHLDVQSLSPCMGASGSQRRAEA